MSSKVVPDTGKFEDALKGKIAIVTGGSSGIGLATTALFASHGAIVVNCDVQPPKGKSDIAYLSCDVSQWPDIVRVFSQVKKEHGRIDIVCANAGISDQENLLKDDLDEPDWTCLDVNLKGPLMTAKAAFYYFKRNPNGGNLVITGSITTFLPAHHGMYLYATSKTGLIGFLRTAVQHATANSIRVNLIAPYLTRTGRDATKVGKDWRKDQPVNEASAIAQGIAHLIADPTCQGRALISVGNDYYEEESSRERLFPALLGPDVAKNWGKVLLFNPFSHMQ